MNGAIPSLEELFTQDFGVRTPTPLQRAICRIADGARLGELADHPDVLAAIGPMMGPRSVPKTMLLLCAVRSGKSMLASAAAIRCGLTCDVSPCGPGDIPRVPVLSTRKEEAKVIYDHLMGAFRTSPRLAALLVREPTKDSITFRHPTGRPIEIKIVAGARAGTSLAARWLAGVIFDEAGKMVGANEAVVNLDDARHNVAGRLMQSACAREWMTTSPWAPFGPVYTIVVDRWRRSSAALVVVRARGDLMNPQWWTPARAAELAETNPDAYRTDFLAEFSDPESALIAGAHLERATRATPLELVPEDPRTDRWEYAAEMDPATRGNAWTLVVTKRVGRKTVVCLAREWKGSRVRPLAIKEVLREIAELLQPFKIAQSEDGRRRVGTDQHALEQLRQVGKEVGLDVVEFPGTRAGNDNGYFELARRFELGEIEIPALPNLLSDLRRLRKVVVAGGVHVELPKSSDGRHCDFAPPIMRASQRATRQPVREDPRPPWQREQEASLARARARYAPPAEVPWWKRGIA